MDDWIDAIDQNERGERTPITLVATKADLTHDRKVNENVGYDYKADLNNRCNKSNFTNGQRCQIFRETSAFEDVGSVTTLFHEITAEIVKNKIYD